MKIRKGDIVRVPEYGVAQVVKGKHFMMRGFGDKVCWNEVLVSCGRRAPLVWFETKELRVVRRCQK